MDADGRRRYWNRSSGQELWRFAGELPGVPEHHAANPDVHKQLDSVEVC